MSTGKEKCNKRVYYATGDHRWTPCVCEKDHDGDCKSACLKKVNGRYSRFSITSAAREESCDLPVRHDGPCCDKHGRQAFPDDSFQFTILHGKVLTTYGKGERVLSRKRVK